MITKVKRYYSWSAEPRICHYFGVLLLLSHTSYSKSIIALLYSLLLSSICTSLLSTCGTFVHIILHWYPVLVPSSAQLPFFLSLSITFSSTSILTTSIFSSLLFSSLLFPSNPSFSYFLSSSSITLSDPSISQYPSVLFFLSFIYFSIYQSIKISSLLSFPLYLHFVESFDLTLSDHGVVNTQNIMLRLTPNRKPTAEGRIFDDNQI